MGAGSTCQFCGGSRRVNLAALHRPVEPYGYGEFQDSELPVASTFPCPACADVVKVENVSMIFGITKMRGMLRDEDRAVQGAKDTASRAIAQKLQDGHMNFYYTPDPTDEHYGRDTYRAVVGVVSKETTGRLYELLAKRQGEFAQEFIDNLRADIARWGSLHEMQNISKPALNHLIDSALKSTQETFSGEVRQD